VEVKHLSALEELLNYELPKHLIAQKLSDPRDACRLLVVHRDTVLWRTSAFIRSRITLSLGMY